MTGREKEEEKRREREEERRREERETLSVLLPSFLHPSGLF